MRIFAISFRCDRCACVNLAYARESTLTFRICGMPVARNNLLAFSPDFRQNRAERWRFVQMATLTRRQKQMVDYLEHFIGEHGYAPTLAEVGEYFGLSSLATVHKHLKNLESKGFIHRQHNHSRALEISQRRRKAAGAQELALLGSVAAGQPIEAIEGNETISVPEDFVRRDNTFCLRVRGESMVDDGFRDGDYIIVEGRETATNG